MEAISYLSNWITWLLVLVPVGAGLTITYFAVCKAFSGDTGKIAEYNNKIKNTIKAAIIMETISGFITIIKNFYT